MNKVVSVDILASAVDF